MRPHLRSKQEEVTQLPRHGQSGPVVAPPSLQGGMDRQSGEAGRPGSGRLSHLLRHRHLCLAKVPGLGNVTESPSYSPREPRASCWWPVSHTCMDLKWLSPAIQQFQRLSREALPGNCPAPPPQASTRGPRCPRSQMPDTQPTLSSSAWGRAFPVSQVLTTITARCQHGHPGPWWRPPSLPNVGTPASGAARPHLEASRVERGKGTCPELRALSRHETDDRLGHCLVPEEPATAQWATEMALTARSLPNKRHSRVLPSWDPWQTVSPSHEKPWAHSTTNPVCP